MHGAKVRRKIPRAWVRSWHPHTTHHNQTGDIEMSSSTDHGSIRKWADEHQFDAEPMPVGLNNMPKVTLLWATPDPLGANAAFCKMYKGEVVRKMSEISDGEREAMWEDVLSTKLTAPLESIKLHFLVEGVTRSWANQLVRQRTAAYAQESMRFAVKGALAAEAHTPPSIASLSPKDPRRQKWDDCLLMIDETYSGLIANGIPAEDARGLAPHATTTRIHYVTDLRNLSEHAGNRLCTQAQYEWRNVFVGIVDSIRNYTPDFSCFDAITERAAHASWQTSVAWQFDEIASSQLFRPACYQAGRCPFKASFDRSCKIRERVDLFERHNIPSADWDEEALPEGAMFPIPPIDPAEWLLDPGAARKTN
jgi:flavin-dependent thymidylate synthase